MHPGVGALEVHQYILFRHLKIEFFSKNVGQPKNAYFLEKKTVKSPQRPGTPPTNPRCPQSVLEYSINF